jgi:DNA-binding GntR family transcriptional regulator
VPDLISPISAPSLQELVYQRLRNAIEAGELPSRDDSSGIGLKELARMLRVSTTPVREAIRRLEAEGLVELDRAAGVRVLRLSVRELLEFTEIRLRLETLAVERAIELATQSDIDTAAELLAELDGTADPETWREANLRFHMALYSPSNYPRVLSTIRTTWVAIEPYIRLYSRTAHHLVAAQSEHHALLDAFRSRNPEAAVAMLVAHISRSRRALLDNPVLARMGGEP